VANRFSLFLFPRRKRIPANLLHAKLHLSPQGGGQGIALTLPRSPDIVVFRESGPMAVSPSQGRAPTDDLTIRSPRPTKHEVTRYLFFFFLSNLSATKLPILLCLSPPIHSTDVVGERVILSYRSASRDSGSLPPLSPPHIHLSRAGAGDRALPSRMDDCSLLSLTRAVIFQR